VALRKAAALADAGARLTVVAPVVSDALAAMAGEVRAKRYDAADIVGHRLVLTATNDTAVNAAVHADATNAGVWVNSADDPTNCTFILPAVARNEPVVAAISTGGSSPALASHLRGEAQRWLDSVNAGRAAGILAAQRDEFHAAGISTEDIDWHDSVAAALSDDDHERFKKPSSRNDVTP
jgi:siroheme synthase-like protein